GYAGLMCFRRCAAWSHHAASVLGILVGGLLLSVCDVGYAHADESVTSCGVSPNLVFQASSSYGMKMSAQCPGSYLNINSGTNSYSRGQGAIWQAVAPAGLLIVGAKIPVDGVIAYGVNAGSQGQYGGDFYWAGGSSNIRSGDSSLGAGPFAS